MITLLQVALMSGISQVLAQSGNMCGKYQSYSPNACGYTFNADNWNDDGSGYSCMNVNSGGSSFSATWKWANNANSVHSYPHATLKSADLPLQLSKLTSMHASSCWSLGTSPNSSSGINDKELTAGCVKSNVALDLFIDPSATATSAMYEMMIWYLVMPSAYPIGWNAADAGKRKYTLGGVTFSLYYASNGRGQTTYTWLPNKNLTSFDEDYLPLLGYLWGEGFIPESSYLLNLNFGSEAFHSNTNVTFSAQTFAMSITKNTTATR